MTWHLGGTVEDDLFILYAGIETSQLFGLGEAGLMKDLLDIDNINSQEPVKMAAKSEAETFVKNNTEIILKLAFALYESGSLDEQMTEKIHNGEIEVTVPQDFRDLVCAMPRFTWRLVK